MGLGSLFHGDIDSDFAHDDLIKESRLIRDYNVEISFEGMQEDVAVYEFTLTPLPE